MEDVAYAAKGYPDLLIEVVNKTLMDLEANSWAQKTSLSKNKANLFRRAFERGLEKDILSKTEVIIMVEIHGNKKARINEFRKVSNKIAKQYSGRKYNEDEAEDQNPESDYKNFLYVNYCFRG